MLRDQDVWLADIAEACERIQAYVGTMGEDAFRADRKTSDAVVRNLEIIGEAVKQLPESIRAQAPEIEWRRIAGLRDMLIHAYFRIDDGIVWNIVETKVPPLLASVRRLLAATPPA
jgi:uncharacterized protein with HEPN domain